MGQESRWVKKANEICPKWSLQLSFWEGSQSVTWAPGLLRDSNTANESLSKNNLLNWASTLSQCKWGIVIISHSWLHCELLKSEDLQQEIINSSDATGHPPPWCSKHFHTVNHIRGNLCETGPHNATSAPDTAFKQTPPDSGPITASFNYQHVRKWGDGGLRENLSCWHL